VTTIGFLGYGEAGAAISAGLGAGGVRGVVAYDIAWEASDLIRRRASENDVTLLPDPGSLASSADVIISAVVCTEARAAALSLADGLGDRHWFLDINSVSPGVKAAIAESLLPQGVRYVDVAVMSNVSSDLARLPLLGAGPDAEGVPGVLGVSLNYEVVSQAPGDAARIKMFRSLFVKGLEALALESMLACYPSGVHEQVLATLEGTFEKYSFGGLVKHLIERHAVHGKRRANELEEVAESLREVGVEPIMAEAAFRRMSWDVERGLQERFQGGEDPDWLSVLEELERLRSRADWASPRAPSVGFPPESEAFSGGTEKQSTKSADLSADPARTETP
jgi:3-hydroxyisobutyrate dehydrogenase-like beta-hydroxyacid dehydrogenase